MFWIIPAVIAAVLIMILLSRIYIECHYTYQQQGQVMRIKVSIFHIQLFKKEIVLSGGNANRVTPNQDTDKFKEKVNDTIHLFRSLPSFVNTQLSKVNIHTLNWITHAGTGDAATTGLAAGALWSVKGVCIGYITEHGILYSKPQIKVIPHYERGCIHSQLDCIVSIRVGQAIHAFLTLMNIGGGLSWKNIQFKD